MDIISFHIYNNPVLQVRKLRHRNIKGRAPDRPAGISSRWCDSTAPRPACSTRLRKRTSKVNLGHIRQSLIHRLPLEVIVIVMTSSLNSYLETQENTHTCHQLLRYKSHKMKQLDTGDKGKNGRHLIWLPRVNSPQIWALSSHFPPKKWGPSYTYIKKPAHAQASSQIGFTRLWSHWSACDFEG